MEVGRLLPYAYGGRHGTQGTVPARWCDIGEGAGYKRSPAQGRVSQPVHNYEAVYFPDSRGVLGKVEPSGMPAIDPHRPPDHGSRVTNS